MTLVRREIAPPRVPRAAYFTIHARLARKARWVDVSSSPVTPVEHILLFSLTIHERQFTRESSESTIAADAR